MYLKTIVKCMHYDNDTTLGRLLPRALYEELIHGFPDQEHLNEQDKKELAGSRIRKDELRLQPKN